MSRLKHFVNQVRREHGWRSALGTVAEAFVETKILYAFLGVMAFVYGLIFNWDVVKGVISSPATAAQAVSAKNERKEVLPAKSERANANVEPSTASSPQYLPDEYFSRGREEGNVKPYERD